jgi:HK97 family phage portal protein
VGLLSRIFGPSAEKSTEGQYRPGPYWTSAGLIGADYGWNWWQQGYDPLPYGERLAIIEACVSAYAQTIAMCPGDHWRQTGGNGRERVTTSALSRILRQPNSYQGASDFLLNLVRSLMTQGNAYALAIRNNRYEVQELHLMSSVSSRAVVSETGEIFYYLGGNSIIESAIRAQSGQSLGWVPARDVLHVRLHTPRDPLIGESPLVNAALDVQMAGMMSAQQIAFYGNQGRPGAVLTTDQVLTREQVDQLREAWDKQSQGLNAGKMPILSAGLKVQPWGATAEAAQFAEVMKLTKENIALAYRVPLPVLGIGGSPMGSTEALMQLWLGSGLGFAINHVEQAFDRLFGLSGARQEYTEFDTAMLLRSSMKERLESLARAVQGGIYAPNEARAIEDLPEVEYGDEPRVQQQVVPLSAAEGIPAAPSAPPAPAQPAPQKDFADAEQLRLRAAFRRIVYDHAA